MRYLVTGSAGHLGEALVRTLNEQGADIISIDIQDSPFTSHVGSITDPDFVRQLMEGVDVVLHTATLHKPHVATHSRQDFVDVNISGTLTLLDAANASGVSSFVFTSTTSTFGNAMSPPPGAPAVWVTEEMVPQPKNIYGITKLAAENLCLLAWQKDQLPCLVLRTSRFFPEDDDSKATRAQYTNDNIKLNEFLHRRVDIEDVVSAHLTAATRAPDIGYDRFIISATSPFTKDDLKTLRHDAETVVKTYTDYTDIYARNGWSMYPSIERVYVNQHARNRLQWEPAYNFDTMLALTAKEQSPMSPLAKAVGKKGYHDQVFEGEDGPFPVEKDNP